MDDLQTWRARIGLYCARMHRTHCGPNKSCGPDTYSTHVHGRKSLSDGASGGALLAMSLLSIAIAMFSLLTVAGDIELNPGPEKDTNPLEAQLSSVSHLRELKNKLWDVRVEWFRLGVELEIAVPDLDAIKVKHREDPNNCFTDMLSVWLKNNDAPTWTAILSALRTTGTNRRLADKIETELKEGSDTTQTDNDEISSPQPGPGVHFISSLREIARLPICNWYEVGTALKLDQYDLQSIQQKSTGDMNVCKIQMLKKWFNSNTQVTYEDLVKALFSTGYENMEVAKEVCKKQGISASTIKVPQPLCVKQYVESLKAEYIRMPILKKDPWPPPPCEKYCDLIWAFTNEKMKFGDSLAEIFEVDIGKLQLLVNGMPGVGKTTFCKQIAKEWANGEILQNYDIVLLIQLRDPQNSGAKAYGDFFYHDEEHIKKEVIKHIGRCSGEGVLFIFDGFDELSKRDRNKGSLFLDIFNGKKLKESSVVIASRPYASHNLEYSQCIELIGFDDDLIKSCIQESIKDKAEAEQLQIRIIEDNDLKQLCTVPNNLAIVIYIYKQENRVLPNTLTKLYSNFIRNTVDRNAQDLKHKKRAKYERYLEELAFKGLSEDKLTFTVDEMSVEEASTLGLMTASESYGSSGRKIAYNFLHLTIQEYLAACWIASNFTAKEQIQFVRSNYDDSRFFVSLKFLAGLSKLLNSDFNDALQLILEMALNDAYFHVTSGNRLNDANSYRPFYSGKQLQSLQFLVSLLRERDEISAIDGENMQSCSSNDDQVLLLDLKHIPSNYNQILLRSFILKSRITWERLEVMFDRTKGYEQLTELLKESCCNVRQLGLHNFSLLNCSDLLECPMFDKLEYLRVDSILHFREVCFNDQTVRWGADNNPKDCDKLKNLLKNGQLKHLLLHHITPLEADYIVRQSVTPYLAKCINLETLCLHFERKVPSELLLDLFQAVQSNRSIVTLNLSIGFDTLAIQPPFNPNIPACISYIKVNERHKIVKALHKMIEKNISIQNLSITRTESIRDNVFHWVDDTSNFMSVFSFKPTITTLTISCNLLYVPLLGELLKHNKTLTSLTLTEVDSMYKGVLKSSRGIFIFLVQGLKQNTTLKRLCLNSSKFHFSGQYYPKCENCALDSAVFMNGIVKAEIDSNNHLFHLLKAIQSHLSLEVLVFDYYSELQEQKILFTCTEEFKRTTQFCLFSDKNQKALFDLLLHNKCLQSLTISGFNFTGIQLRQAAQALVLNGHRASFNIMLTENLSKDDDFNKSFMDLFNFKDDKRNQPHSDVIRSSVMSIRSVQKLQESHKDEATNASDSKQSSDDSESYDHDFQKVDKNGDSIQDDVIEFKEVMFRAMVTVFSKILCNRHVHQHCFLKHANRPSLT